MNNIEKETIWDGRLRERKSKSKNESIWLDRLRDRVGDISYKEIDNKDIVNDVYNEINLLNKKFKNK